MAAIWANWKRFRKSPRADDIRAVRVSFISRRLFRRVFPCSRPYWDFLDAGILSMTHELSERRGSTRHDTTIWILQVGSWTNGKLETKVDVSVGCKTWSDWLLVAAAAESVSGFPVRGICPARGVKTSRGACKKGLTNGRRQLKRCDIAGYKVFGIRRYILNGRARRPPPVAATSSGNENVYSVVAGPSAAAAEAGDVPFSGTWWTHNG